MCETISKGEVRKLGDNWIAETKLDGSRLIAINNGSVKLQSRRGNYKGNRFPYIKEEISQLPDCIVDGELVVFNDQGISRHNLLMKRETDSFHKIELLKDTLKAEYWVFDILEVEGNNLRDDSLEARKRVLEDRIEESGHIKVIPFNKDRVKMAESNRGEGVVFKNLNSPYQEGKRSSRWRKLKFQEEKVVEIVDYEEHEKGITMVSEEGHRINNPSPQDSETVRERLDQGEKVKVEVTYLEETDNERLRFPRHKRVINEDEN